ncbi:GL16730 [Drosophila persimilis]|uniref:GL16730 n=1 Tax=Drosophila persimilis TaxID=7234 RepID=B4GIL8_DROPE|nr:uncharacterized protein LOC6592623 [Drosophila persimilis]EDW36338.1 GL16730 [Drosophila persimilis]
MHDLPIDRGDAVNDLWTEDQGRTEGNLRRKLNADRIDTASTIAIPPALRADTLSGNNLLCSDPLLLPRQVASSGLRRRCLLRGGFHVVLSGGPRDDSWLDCVSQTVLQRAIGMMPLLCR